MRKIDKGRELPSLAAHRQTPFCDYDNYQDKEALRRALATEQRGLCCYCMGSIRPEGRKMKIEHWQSRTAYPEKQLDYRNLLGACKGGEGNPSSRQHCDTRKGDRELCYNPADLDHAIESRVRYDPDGTIRSDDATFDDQLNEILNLNLASLKKHRKRQFDVVAEWWKKERARNMGPVSRQKIEREINKRLLGSGDLTPYCQVAIWFLQRKLASMP